MFHPFLGVPKPLLQLAADRAFFPCSFQVVFPVPGVKEGEILWCTKRSGTAKPGPTPLCSWQSKAPPTADIVLE